MRRLSLILLTSCIAGCGFKPAKVFAPYTQLEVQEVGRSLQCHSTATDSAIQLFSNANAVQEWQARHSLNLIAPAALSEAPYAAIEMGQRPTGGYGLAVSRAAVLRGELVILSATFISPPPDRIVSQALTSPCVLVRLPPGRYRTIEVQDQAGAVRATGVAKDPTDTEGSVEVAP